MCIYTLKYICLNTFIDCFTHLIIHLLCIYSFIFLPIYSSVLLFIYCIYFFIFSVDVQLTSGSGNCNLEISVEKEEGGGR